MTSFIDDPLLWISLGVLAAAVLAVWRARRTNIQLRANIKGLEGNLASKESYLAKLDTSHASLNARHADELEEVRKDAASATKATLKSAMGIQSGLAEELLALLDALQNKYGADSEVLADLMQADHLGNQFSRRAKGISLLCGGWLGRRDDPASVYDVARNAQGRIRDFGRVRVNSQVNAFITSTAVEPIAMALAELLDNATKYSAPGTPVEVNIQQVPTGICLIVDDAGLGMDQETKSRAAALLSATGPVDITSLGDPPQFGFALCGTLAERNKFFVSVDAVSPYGGVRAVVRVPSDLLSADIPDPADAAQDGAADERSAPGGPVVMPSRVVGTTAGGLPRRRRRDRSTVAIVAPADATTPEPSEASDENRARSLGAFARGTRLGRDSAGTDGTAAPASSPRLGFPRTATHGYDSDNTEGTQNQ
ncbi:ATP-binding protein [Streptomyces sp. NPDC005917]|uniref:ATP-binding protein n=1 Tax=unclassified Streptomyces TaxID=2593676 RepID=UPI0033F263CA